jgi:hypothetical protein
MRISGVSPRALTVARRPDWPHLRVTHRIEPTAAGPAHIDDTSMRLPLGPRDWIALDRDRQTATYLTHGDLDHDTLVHPWLAPAAGIMGRWMGKEAFHAGAFVAGGGAWALAGANEIGKSSLLAALGVAGTPILTDDLLVVDNGLAYAGTRCIDLRELHALDAVSAERVRVVRDGARYRLDLPAVEPAVPLRGWFFLEWGSEVEAIRSSAADRLAKIATQRRWATGAPDPRVLLELASLPAWELRRPRGWSHLDTLLECLYDLTGGAPEGATRDGRAVPA